MKKFILDKDENLINSDYIICIKKGKTYDGDVLKYVIEATYIDHRFTNFTCNKTIIKIDSDDRYINNYYSALISKFCAN